MKLTTTQRMRQRVAARQVQCHCGKIAVAMEGSAPICARCLAWQKDYYREKPDSSEGRKRVEKRSALYKYNPNPAESGLPTQTVNLPRKLWQW